LPDGVFDNALFAYYEDVDLAWRLGRLGWRHLYVPSAVAHHERRGPGSKPRSIAARAFTNRYRVWYKNETFKRFCTYAPVCVPWEIARLARLARRDPKLAWAIFGQLWQRDAIPAGATSCDKNNNKPDSCAGASQRTNAA
jgi:GT2 family glycosyltransferase